MATPSEALVLRLCTSSFMSLWSCASPLRADGNELCDVLVVFDPHVLIFSVKEVIAKDTGRPEVDWARWSREAIDKSIDQVFGAERELRLHSHVLRSDRSQGLALPPLDRRRVHRLVVALGSGGTIPIAVPRPDKGHIHVLDERSLSVLMGELDTIADFTSYLDAKQAFLESTRTVMNGEEDLLAMYLRRGRVFPSGNDFAWVEEGLWDAFIKEDAVRAGNDANAASRAFDDLIVRVMRDLEAGSLEPGSDLGMTEELLRTMASECRFNRRILGAAFMDFMKAAAALPTGLARKTVSPSGVVYVFLAVPRELERDIRQADLQMRTFVARGLHPECTTAVGIATERLDGKQGVSIDACLLRIPEWTDAQQAQLKSLQEEFGIFVAPKLTSGRIDEYPDAPR